MKAKAYLFASLYFQSSADRWIYKYLSLYTLLFFLCFIFTRHASPCLTRLMADISDCNKIELNPPRVEWNYPERTQL